VRWTGAAKALLPLVAITCAGLGVQPEELPDQPIAVLYWEPEAARRRAEAMAKLSGGEQSTLGIARISEIGEMLGGRTDDAEHSLAILTRWPGHLSLLHPRTGEITRVEAAAAGSRPLSWSSDRRRLLFSTGRTTGVPQLFEYDLQKREVRPLTHGDESHAWGSYGPDDRLVYLGVRRAGKEVRRRLYVTDARGAGERPVTEGQIADSPRFAPGGDAILYTRPAPSGPRVRGRHSRAPQLVFLPVGEGSASQERLLGRGREPVFSPSGEWIVYSAEFREGRRLARVRWDGSGRRPLGQGSRDEWSPAISPDGRYVAFMTREGEFDRVFVRRFDGSGDRMLLEEGAAAWPVW
jgi:Tol biopolymer transport system component